MQLFSCSLLRNSHNLTPPERKEEEEETAATAVAVSKNEKALVEGQSLSVSTKKTNTDVIQFDP